MTNAMGKQTALITGASGGIGYELSKLFARDGYNLVLVARSGERLEQIAADFRQQHRIAVTVISQDLAQPNAAHEVFGTLQQASIHVDVLVNNAGYTMYGAFAQMDWQRELDLMQVNMIALTQLMRLCLPPMIQRGAGKVLNLASTAAFLPGPMMAIYYATKAYVLSLSEAVANELEGTGVTVTALCPGPTETGFQARGDMQGVRLVSNGNLMSASVVAQAGYRALMQGKAVEVPGVANKLGVWAVRFLPRRFATQTVRRMHAREP